MTTIVEDEGRPRDHYKASIEDGSLEMKPYCFCGNMLDENYFCDKCQKRCHCNLIVCEDEATLDMVNTFIRKSSSFSAFRAKLKDKPNSKTSQTQRQAKLKDKID